MTNPTLRRLLLLVLPPALLLGALPSPAQDDSVEKKKKEGRYYVELGQIYLQSDDFNIRAGELDADGFLGPGAPRAVDVQADTPYFTDPYVAFGYVFPSGKFVASISTLWYNNSEGTLTNVGPDEDMTGMLGIPGLVFYRTQFSIPPSDPNDPVKGYEVPNWLETSEVDLDREFKSVDASFSQNVWQNKKFLLRADYGFRHISFQERIDVTYNYGEEQIALGSPNVVYEWNDRQKVQANSDTKLFGLQAGLTARLGLGKNSKWTLRGGFHVGGGPESVSLQYRSESYEINPQNINLAAILNPTQTVGGYAWAPGGVVDRDLGIYSINIRTSEPDEILFWGDAFFKVEFTPVNYMTIGLGYDYLTIQNMLSARDAIDKVNENLTDLRIDLQGLGDTDPQNDRRVTLYSWNGTPYSGTLGQDAVAAEADIESRRDYAFQGIRFYLRFNF